MVNLPPRSVIKVRVHWILTPGLRMSGVRGAGSPVVFTPPNIDKKGVNARSSQAADVAII